MAKTLEQIFARGETEASVAVTSSSGSLVIDCSLSNTFVHVMTENTTISFINLPPDGLAYGLTLEIIQDASGSEFTFSWNDLVIWPGSAEPILSTGANDIDIFVIYKRSDAALLRGFVAAVDSGLPA